MHISMATMKRAAIALLLFLTVASPAFAILRPRYPTRPMPPFSGEWIIIGDDAIKKEILPSK
jgi:hypothetical protein